MKEKIPTPGWREKIWLWLIDRTTIVIGKKWAQRVFTSWAGIIPDNITAIKLVAMGVVWHYWHLDLLCFSVLLKALIACVISDVFDGALARALQIKGWQPQRFILARLIRFLHGAAFDTLTDKLAILTGVFMVWQLGFPGGPLIPVLFWPVMKVIIAVHGGWLTGINYRDLLGVQKNPTLQQSLSHYFQIALTANWMGKIEGILHSAIILLAIFWTGWPSPRIITAGWLLGSMTFIFGFLTFRFYVRRYLLSCLESKLKWFVAYTDIPFSQRNLPTIKISRTAIALAGYFSLQPKNC